MQYVGLGGFAFLFGMSLPWVGACAHQDAADRSAEQLKADITKMQADRDRLDERLGALEAAEQRRETGHKPRAENGPEPVPRLPVVRVGDGEGGGPPLAPTEGEAPDTETDTGDPRPVVQETGSRAAASSKRGRSGSRV